MVAAFDIYVILNVIKWIGFIMFCILCFFHKDNTNAKIFRLAISNLMMLIALIQIPMKIQMGESDVLSSIFVIIWHTIALAEANSLR